MFWAAMAMSVSAEESENTLPSVTYQTHVQNVGWQDYVEEGKMSGTEGMSYRLEGIRIALDSNGYDLGIQYQTHIQNIGWEEEAGRGWKTDKQMSGTEGLSYRLEAIQIKLTGADADKFDVYYQVHAQNMGWLGWAKNGESAGTAGYGYRLEGIKIKIIEKGSVTENTGVPFYENLLNYKTYLGKIGTYTEYNFSRWSETAKMSESSGSESNNQTIRGLNVFWKDGAKPDGVDINFTIYHLFEADGGIIVSNPVPVGSEESGYYYRKDLPLSNIKFDLTGKNADDYDIFYQVSYDGENEWREWVSEGEIFKYHHMHYIQAIKVVLLPVGTSPFFTLSAIQ